MTELSRFFPEGLSPALSTLAQIFWLIQLALVIHVYRTGRPYWWTFVLFAAPIIGGLAYVFIELLPDFRGPRGLWYSIKPRSWRIADRRAELEESETVENRLALAEELFAAGETKEAHDAAKECLQGVFKDDPHTMAAVAHYELALKQYADAYALLERINTKADRMLEVRVAVMRGEALLGLARYSEAEEAFESVQGRYIGEAARAGLALIYESTGRSDEAAETWKAIRTRFRKASPAWRRTERTWYKLATAKLKAARA